MDSRLWDQPKITSPHEDQANIPPAPNYEGTTLCEFSNNIGSTTCRYSMVDAAACNVWDEPPVSQMTSVPLWVDDALFGPLERVSNSRVHQKNSSDVRALGLPDFGGGIMNNMDARGRVSPIHVDDYSPFRFSDPLPGILPSKIDVASLRAANLNIGSLSNDAGRDRARLAETDVQGGGIFASSGVKSRKQPRQAPSYDQSTDPELFASDPLIEVDSYHESFAQVSVPDVFKLGPASEQIVDVPGTGFDLPSAPQPDGYSLSNGQITTASDKDDIEKYIRGERGCELPNAIISGCGFETPIRNEQHIERNEQEPAAMNASSVATEDSPGVSNSPHDLSKELHETEQCSQLKIQNAEHDPKQRSHKEFSSKTGPEKTMIPQFSDMFSSRIHQYGCKDTGTKGEDIKLQRAQRNRESAKRSRLKSKLLHQKMTETYDRLKDENRALKVLVEKLVEDCRSAPREVQDKLKAILHEKRAARDK
jgi:hypothetical protein